MQKGISQPWAARASNLVSETWIWGGETCWCPASLGETLLPLSGICRKRFSVTYLECSFYFIHWGSGVMAQMSQTHNFIGLI